MKDLQKQLKMERDENRTLNKRIQNTEMELRKMGGGKKSSVSSRPLYMPVAHLETQISRIHILDI